MSDQEIEISALEVYAMVVARDALFEQLLQLIHGPELAAMWEATVDEIDHAIRHGLLKDVLGINETDDAT
jgi:hypothetical protein